jgi:hypothetical protein
MLKPESVWHNLREGPCYAEAVPSCLPTRRRQLVNAARTASGSARPLRLPDPELKCGVVPRRLPISTRGTSPITRPRPASDLVADRMRSGPWPPEMTGTLQAYDTCIMSPRSLLQRRIVKKMGLRT